ncbi:MAG TPA: elongation factor Ts, partial [bacterium]
VLVEVNSETDFVARNKEFNDFVKEISMQIAATNPRYILREEIPPEVIENEKKIYAAQIDGTNKNEKILQKIIEGKLEKFYSEVCLIEQPYIRDESVKIKELLDIIIAKFGENIVIRRFVRFQLGEELAKKL